MTVGTVKWFNADKGYGFIQPESGEDVRALQRHPDERLPLAERGQAVEFDVAQGPKGPQAANVRPIEAQYTRRHGDPIRPRVGSPRSQGSRWSRPLERRSRA